MKKILSLTLAALLLVSMIPTAMAAETNPAADGTTIKLVGSQEAAGESYTVTVPAELQPGQSGTVTASGNWSSKQTLKVTAPNSVTLSYGEQTMDVGITFAGIEQVGSDTAASSATASVAVADASALFGTWTGTLTYTVEMVTEEYTFTISGTEYEFENGMTWGEWCDSEYNPSHQAGRLFFDYGSYITSSSGADVQYNGVNVTSTDKIIDGATYTLKATGGAQ